jgi:hypothetical protein
MLMFLEEVRPQGQIQIQNSKTLLFLRFSNTKVGNN